MQKMKTVQGLGVWSLLAMLCVAGAHAVLGDELVFHSDLYSLAVYITSVSLGMWIVLIPVVLAIRRLPAKWRDRTDNALLIVLLMGMLTIFLRLVVGLYVRQAFIGEVTIGCACAAAVISLAVSRRQDVIERIRHLGYLGFVCVFLFAPISVAWNHLSCLKFQRKKPARQLVAIVLDGFPAQYLHTYNSAMPVTSMDELLKHAHVVRNMQTGIPYTYGFFGQLYSGLDSMEIHDGSLMRIRYGDTRPPGLLKTLQRAGVGARWISYHRNGFPDGSAAQDGSYIGLRSYFLTEHYTCVPRLLGCEYHVALNRSSCRKNLRGPLGAAVHRWLNGFWPSTGDVLLDVLLPEIRQLQSRHDRSFILFHIGWTDATTTKMVFPSAQGGDRKDPLAPQMVRIRKSGYTYEADQEPIAATIRESVAKSVKTTGDSLRPLLDAISSRTTLVVTADHGSMFSKGRFWYGYHPNEEVVNVLCAVFNGPRNGVDQRLFSTADLTASILDFLAVEKRLNETATSFFSTAPGREYTSTLTRGSDTEWWLVITGTDIRYWCNICTEGDGQILAFRSRTYDEQGWPDEENARLDKISQDLVPIIREAIYSYGLEGEAVHPRIAVAIGMRNVDNRTEIVRPSPSRRD